MSRAGAGAGKAPNSKPPLGLCGLCETWARPRPCTSPSSRTMRRGEGDSIVAAAARARSVRTKAWPRVQRREAGPPPLPGGAVCAPSPGQDARTGLDHRHVDSVLPPFAPGLGLGRPAKATYTKGLALGAGREAAGGRAPGLTGSEARCLLPPGLHLRPHWGHRDHRDKVQGPGAAAKCTLPIGKLFTKDITHTYTMISFPSTHSPNLLLI